MGGVYNIWGALVAALFLRAPARAARHRLGSSTEVLTMLFGLGVIQVLLTAPAGIVEQIRRSSAGLGRKLDGLAGKTAPEAAT